jgi:hypothetical protein
METNDSDAKMAELTLALLASVADGQLDGLECPECHKPTVSVWFTHARNGEYRTWFLCQACPFSSRAQNTGRPKHFTESRVHQDLERYDFELGNNRKFPPPAESAGDDSEETMNGAANNANRRG